MTLLEMIKKYEGIREKMHIVQQKEDEEIVEAILGDLRSVLKDTSEISIHNMALDKLRHAIERNNFDDAFRIAQVINLLFV